MCTDSTSSIRKASDQPASNVIDHQLDISLGGGGKPQRCPSVRRIRSRSREENPGTAGPRIFDRRRGGGQHREIISEDEQRLPDFAVNLAKFELGEAGGPCIDHAEKLMPGSDTAAAVGRYFVE